MTSRLFQITVTIAVTALLVAGASAPASAKGRSIEQRTADYNSCDANGGSMRDCCAAAGGSYDPPHPVTAASGRVVMVETCLIEGTEIKHTLPGAKLSSGAANGSRLLSN